MQIAKLDDSFLTLSGKENLLTCRLEGAHQYSDFLHRYYGICNVLAKENNTSPGCINCLHERHLLQPEKHSIFKSIDG